MFKVFVKGFVFGVGALVAFLLGLIFYKLIGAYEFSSSLHADQPVIASEDAAQQRVRLNFGDMTLEQQITEASVIFVTRFEAGEDGRQKAIISEILKSPSGGAFPFVVGDEYGRLSVYSSNSSEFGEGNVTFMTGVPPEFQLSITIREGRVGSFGGIPLDKLREKVPNA